MTRTTRSLTLTPEGQAIYERVQGLLRQVEEIEQAASAARAEPAGVIKVASSLPVGVHVLAPLLPLFRELYPKLSVDLRLSDRLVSLVEEGIDVAIRIGNLSDSRLIARELARHRVCAFASPAYLAKRGVPQRPEELLEHDCVNVRFQSSGQILRWPFQVGDRVIEIQPNDHIVVDVSDAVVATLVAGGGIGMAPTYVAAPHVKRGELVPVLAEYSVDRAPITALWPHSRGDSPNVEVFVRFLREHFPRPTPWNEGPCWVASLGPSFARPLNG